MKFSFKWVRQTFKQYSFSISLTIVLTFTILILLGAVVAQEALWLTKSTATISLSGQKLNVSFNINPSERVGFDQFSSNLGVGSDWLEGISMTVDQKTADQLKNLLPKTVKIEASARKIVFNSTLLPTWSKTQLSSALPSNDGSVSILQQDGVWQIDIKDTAAAIESATASGQLKLAAGTFEQFWPVLSKFATIRAEIGLNSLRGYLILK